MMLNKLIPLLVMGGIAYHGADAIEERVDRVLGMGDRFQAKQRMSTVLRAARLQIATGESVQLRDQNDLQTFIRENVRIKNRERADPSLDPWGSPFRHEKTQKGVTLISAGPDGRFGTSDDLRVTRNIYRY